MPPNGLLLLLEEPYLGSGRTDTNIRGMILADALRHKLKVAQRYYKIREYLAARKELPVHKRAREPSPSLDEDAMVVDDAAPACNPIKRGRFEAPRSMKDRPFRRLATSMRVHSGPDGIRLAMRQEEGTVRIVLRSTRPLQPAIRPRWRPNDTRPKFSVASLAQTDETLHNPLSYHYALHLRLCPKEGNVRHAAFLHHDNLGDIYVTPIDTADCIYWFFQDNFAVVNPLHLLLDTPPVEFASFGDSALSASGELGVDSPYQGPQDDFGGDSYSYDFSFSFNPDAGSHPKLGGAPCDVSLDIHPEVEGRVQSFDGLNPLHMGAWDEVPLFEDVFGADPIYGGETSTGSLSGHVLNVPTETTESMPTSASVDPALSHSCVTVSDSQGPLNATGTTPPGGAAEHAQARVGIRIGLSDGASRVAVSPSGTSIAHDPKGEASEDVRTEKAEMGRSRPDEDLTVDSPRGKVSSPITHLAQGSTEAGGSHSFPALNAAEPQALQEGASEGTEPLLSPENTVEEVPQQRPPVSSTTRMGLYKRTIPPGAEDDLKDTQEIRYGDGGNALISRWRLQDASVPFEFPSWCWNNNAEGATSLELPRILAHRVNQGLMAQQWDGNFGLAVPGWRSPWTNSDDIKPEDQVTFFDVLQHNNDVRVDKPWIMTLRLLWPQAQSISAGKARQTLSGDRARSFVYFGDGEPCAMLGSSDTEPIAPQWGPRIPIWPQMPENDIYTFWLLRLLSMTLLKPVCDDPDYTIDSHWESIEIEMPIPPGSHRGAETILDTCATRSHFHPDVIDKITRWWLKDPQIQEFDNGLKDIYVERPEDYENFDIVFKFLGSDNEVANFRCAAQDFLVSPFKVEGRGYYCPFAEMKGVDHLISPYASSTLGTNFFWCAITRLVAPPHDGTRGGWDLTRAERPYVQLAPQRIVLNGQKVGGPQDIKIYEEYPPWFQLGRHDPMRMAP